MEIHEIRIRMVVRMSEDQALEWWSNLVELLTEDDTNWSNKEPIGRHLLPGEGIEIVGINDIDNK